MTHDAAVIVFMVVRLEDARERTESCLLHASESDVTRAARASAIATALLVPWAMMINSSGLWVFTWVDVRFVSYEPISVRQAISYYLPLTHLAACIILGQDKPMGGACAWIVIGTTTKHTIRCVYDVILCT